MTSGNPAQETPQLQRRKKNFSSPSSCKNRVFKAAKTISHNLTTLRCVTLVICNLEPSIIVTTKNNLPRQGKKICDRQSFQYTLTRTLRNCQYCDFFSQTITLLSFNRLTSNLICSYLSASPTTSSRPLALSISY